MTGDPVPRTLDAVVAEIAAFAGLPRSEVAERARQEARALGWNVNRDVARFGVTPHVFDERMAALYRDGDGFIFETLVFWTRPERATWTERALARLVRHAARAGRSVGALRVLVLGDGAGNDSLFLAARGLSLDYFDVPGSRTSAFARSRFEARRPLAGAIGVVTDYDALRTGDYDAVVCFELLEHLEDPVRAVADLAAMLRPGGIALVTEGFGAVHPYLPTHLRANERLDGTTPFLFLAHGMRLTWYGRRPTFKPFEFERVERARPSDVARLLLDPTVMARRLSAASRRLRKRLRA